MAECAVRSATSVRHGNHQAGSMPVYASGSVGVGPSPTSTYKKSTDCQNQVESVLMVRAQEPFPTSGHPTTPVKLPWKRAGMETRSPVSSTIQAPALYYNRFPPRHSCQSTVPKAFCRVPNPARTAMETVSIAAPCILATLYVLKPSSSISHALHDITMTSS